MLAVEKIIQYQLNQFNISINLTLSSGHFHQLILLTELTLKLLIGIIHHDIPESPPPLTNPNITGPPARSETNPPTNKSQTNQTNTTILPTSYYKKADAIFKIWRIR